MGEDAEVKLIAEPPTKGLLRFTQGPAQYNDELCRHRGTETLADAFVGSLQLQYNRTSRSRPA